MLQVAVLRYGYVVLFIGAAIDGDASLLTGAFLAHRGYLRTPAVILTAAVATAIANQVYFWIARRRGRPALDRMYASRRFARLGNVLKRHAVPLLFVSRFVYGFRIAIPAACGALGMSPGVFTLVDVAGAALWSLILGLAGYSIGHVLETLVGDLRPYEWQIAATLLGATLAALAVGGRDWKSGRLLTVPPDVPETSRDGQSSGNDGCPS